MSANGHPIQAHLNGGPRDDETVVLPPYRTKYLVPGEAWAPEFAGWAKPPTIGRIGSYEARFDSCGDFVPHDLSGLVEFDWKGWRP